jgi:hypothetical protein
VCIYYHCGAQWAVRFEKISCSSRGERGLIELFQSQTDWSLAGSVHMHAHKLARALNKKIKKLNHDLYCQCVRKSTARAYGIHGNSSCSFNNENKTQTGCRFEKIVTIGLLMKTCYERWKYVYAPTREVYLLFELLSSLISSVASIFQIQTLSKVFKQWPNHYTPYNNIHII